MKMKFDNLSSKFDNSVILRPIYFILPNIPSIILIGDNDKYNLHKLHTQEKHANIE